MNKKLVEKCIDRTMGAVHSFHYLLLEYLKTVRIMQRCIYRKKTLEK